MVTLEAILGYGNLKEAALAVRRNKGAAGIDGIKTKELVKWFYDHPYKLTESIKRRYIQTAANQKSIHTKAQR